MACAVRAQGWECWCVDLLECQVRTVGMGRLPERGDQVFFLLETPLFAVAHTVTDSLGLLSTRAP